MSNLHPTPRSSRTHHANGAPRFTLAVGADAGLLREYLAWQLGPILEFGGTWSRYAQLMRLAKRLARLAGIPLDEVLANVRADHDAIEAQA